MKKVKVFQRISDFESFINSPKVNILSYDVKAVVKSEVNRDGFLASVFYDEKEINNEKEIDDDLETDLSRAVNDAIARKDPEKYIEKFVVKPVFGECQFCMTAMAESYAIPIQAIKAAFWSLYKKQTFKYLRKYTVEVINGRVLEFVVFKTRDSIDFDNEPNAIPSESNAVLEASNAAPGETNAVLEASNAVLNELLSSIEEGINEMIKREKRYHDIHPRLERFLNEDNDYSYWCIINAKLMLTKHPK